MPRIDNHCPKCGESNGAKGPFCPRCGWKYSDLVATPVIDHQHEHKETVSAANADTDKTNGGTNTMDNRNSILGTILRILLGVLLVVAIIILIGYFVRGCQDNKAIINSITAATTTAAPAATTTATTETAATTAATTTAPTTTAPTTAVTTTAATTTLTPAVTTVATIGLDQPSKSWFLAKAGTLISGDVCVFDNDNNSRKIPVYDSKEGTADVIYLTSDTYVWTEWGCYTIENANANDVATLVNDKLANGNFTSIRYFNGFTKLGTNSPVIINSKIDASAITLPVITPSK